MADLPNVTQSIHARKIERRDLHRGRGLIAAALLAASLVASLAAAQDEAPDYITARMREAHGIEIPGPTPARDATPEELTPSTPEGEPQELRSEAALPADVVADALVIDGEAAARVAAVVYRYRPGCPTEDAYEIAHAVARWSRNYGHRPELVAALISVESQFLPGAKSPTGDHGLMQLHGRRIYGISENVKAGCAHLAGNMAAADGDERRALACYNGGGSPPAVSWRYADTVLARAAVQ